jgi:hypothetical protein
MKLELQSYAVNMPVEKSCVKLNIKLNNLERYDIS